MYLPIRKTLIVPDTYSAIPCMSDQLLWPRHDQISQSENHVTDYIIQIQHLQFALDPDGEWYDEVVDGGVMEDSFLLNRLASTSQPKSGYRVKFQ
jgi:hypothetical protein